MSIELYELIDKIVGNNNDVDEILEAMDKDWHVPDRLYEINPDGMTETVFENMTVDEITEQAIESGSITEVLEYIISNYRTDFDKVVEELE